jgi:hypothetical protein
MLVFTDVITPRIQYIFQYLGEKTGITFRLTESLEHYKTEAAPTFNYSSNVISSGEFHIMPCGLLTETGIKQREISLHTQNNFPVFFTTGGVFGFDLPAAIFYLISRYEEYDTFTPDEYGRYPYQDSLANKGGFLQRPLVDEWVNLFAKKISDYYPTIITKIPEFELIPTYDIDIAWSYLHKGWLRNIGGAFKYPGTTPERLRVLTGAQKDPFDCYDQLDEWHEKMNCKPIYFFPVGTKRTSRDKHISPHNPSYRKLIQRISQKADVGLHPSLYSNDHPASLSDEKKILEDIIGKPIHQSRQHYLWLKLPITYRTLINTGITDDYSMGYGTINGFRASTSRSFIWYDLEKEQITSLRIHPLAWMDANSCYEQKLTPEEAADEFICYQQFIQKVKGKLIAVSHNHLIGKQTFWKGWGAYYQKILSNGSSGQT